MTRIVCVAKLDLNVLMQAKSSLSCSSISSPLASHPLLTLSILPLP